MDEEEEPQEKWYCRICDKLIDYEYLRANPGTRLCAECKWKLEEALDGRR